MLTIYNRQAVFLSESRDIQITWKNTTIFFIKKFIFQDGEIITYNI